MTFRPYHYTYINDVIRYYAVSLGYPAIIEILDTGITTEHEAKLFCDFIPILLGQRLKDEMEKKLVPVDCSSGMISDLHYEAASFVCDAGYENVWDAMIDNL